MKLRDNLNRHFKDDPISDMPVKDCLIISCLKHFPGPTKFGPVFSSAIPSNTTTPQIICHYTILTNRKMTYKCWQKDIFHDWTDALRPVLRLSIRSPEVQGRGGVVRRMGTQQHFS